MTSLTRLGPGDSKRMAELHAQSFKPHQAWDETAFEELLSLPTTIALGWTHGHTLRGMIVLQCTPPTAEILTLATHPAAQRAGIASSLLRASTSELVKLDCSRLQLDVAANNAAAIAFYTHHKFIHDARRKNYYRSTGTSRIDAVLMSRLIAGQT